MTLALGKQKPQKAAATEVYNPYLAARREWDERYGDFITRARNWRTMATISGLVALVATCGMVWLSARSHVIPFVVLIDNLGRPVASGLAEQASVCIRMPHTVWRRGRPSLSFLPHDLYRMPMAFLDSRVKLNSVVSCRMRIGLSVAAKRSRVD